MKKMKKAAEAAPSYQDKAKINNPNDLSKVLEYFQYTIGTTLDCSFATGILRNCITWCVRDLEEMGLLQAIYVARDKRTHFNAKHYSADPKKWPKTQNRKKITLFGRV